MGANTQQSMKAAWEEMDDGGGDGGTDLICSLGKLPTTSQQIQCSMFGFPCRAF